MSERTCRGVPEGPAGVPAAKHCDKPTCEGIWQQWWLDRWLCVSVYDLAACERGRYYGPIAPLPPAAKVEAEPLTDSDAAWRERLNSHLGDYLGKSLHQGAVLEIERLQSQLAAAEREALPDSITGKQSVPTLLSEIDRLREQLAAADEPSDARCKQCEFCGEPSESLAYYDRVVYTCRLCCEVNPSFDQRKAMFKPLHDKLAAVTAERDAAREEVERLRVALQQLLDSPIGAAATSIAIAALAPAAPPEEVPAAPPALVPFRIERGRLGETEWAWANQETSDAFLEHAHGGYSTYEKSDGWRPSSSKPIAKPTAPSKPPLPSELREWFDKRDSAVDDKLFSESLPVLNWLRSNFDCTKGGGE